MAKALCQALYLDTRSTVALIGLRKTKPETGNIEPPDVLFQMVDKLRYVSNRWWGGGGGPGLEVSVSKPIQVGRGRAQLSRGAHCELLENRSPASPSSTGL